MAEIGALFQGIVIGLTLAVPVGPLSLICIHRSLIDGRLHGIVSGLGVTTADSLYAAVAVLGLTAVSGLILAYQLLFRTIAGIVLVVVGMKVICSVPARPRGDDTHESYSKDFLSMLALAAANPLTILFFLTILAGSWIVAPGNPYGTEVAFVLGVFIGSASWWVLLCSSLASFRLRLDAAGLLWINRISGLLITALGAGILVLHLVVMRAFP